MRLRLAVLDDEGGERRAHRIAAPDVVHHAQVGFPRLGVERDAYVAVVAAVGEEDVILHIREANVRHAWVHGNIVPPKLDGDADYLMDAETYRWEEMGRGEYGPMRAMMFGRLSFSGPMGEAMGNMGPFEAFLKLVGKVPYDTVRDFTHIAMMGELTMALYVHQSMNASTFPSVPLISSMMSSCWMSTTRPRKLSASRNTSGR